MKNLYAKAVVFRNAVVIDYSSKGKNLRLATGITGVKDDQLKNNALNKGVLDYKKKNLIIGRKLAEINKIIDEHILSTAGQKPTIDYIRDKLNQPNEKGIVFANKNNRTFHYYYNEFYARKEKEAIVRASLKDYKSVYNALVAFDVNKKKLDLETLNSETFLIEWQDFLSKPIPKTRFRGTKGDLNNNTIAKRISTFKTFIRWMCDEKIINLNSKVISFKSKIKKFQPTIVIIENDEIEKLMSLTLQNKEEELRDLLIFSCNTGMRYSDIISLSKSDIIQGAIVKDADKTRKRFKVPLNDVALAILKKNHYSLNLFSITEFNKKIKIFLKKYSICDYDIVSKTEKYNQIVRQTVKKYSKISSHSGRRTFIAGCIKAGCSIPEIMGFTGHKKISSLQVYIDLYREDEHSKLRINKLFEN
jgi:site-specific recombinase XerD